MYKGVYGILLQNTIVINTHWPFYFLVFVHHNLKVIMWFLKHLKTTFLILHYFLF